MNWAYPSSPPVFKIRIDGVQKSRGYSIRDSLEQAGLDPDNLPNHRIDLPEAWKAWRNIYSAGQSVALIDRVEPVADLVARLTGEFEAAVPGEGWRKRLAQVELDWRG